MTGPALAQSTQPSALDKDGALAATTLSGKLWIVAVNTSASFPPPNPTPDATFTTNHAVFIGDGADPTNTKLSIHYTIGSFLASSHPVSTLVFSGLVNPVLGSAVTASTLLSNGVSDGGPTGTYETFIELTGSVRLVVGEDIVLTHDDGVSLKIDGSSVCCFTTGPTFPTAERSRFTGATGAHTIDLVYVETQGGPAELIFSPVP